MVYAALKIYYFNQSEVNKRFKTVIKCVLATELMDIATAITISYGSVIDPKLNILINTVYFTMTFSSGMWEATFIKAPAE